MQSEKTPIDPQTMDDARWAVETLNKINDRKGLIREKYEVTMARKFLEEFYRLAKLNGHDGRQIVEIIAS